MTPPAPWRDTRDGRVRETDFGIWFVEEREELDDDGVTVHEPLLARSNYDQPTEFQTPEDARQCAADLLAAADYLEQALAERLQ